MIVSTEVQMEEESKSDIWWTPKLKSSSKNGNNNHIVACFSRKMFSVIGACTSLGCCGGCLVIAIWLLRCLSVYVCSSAAAGMFWLVMTFINGCLLA